MSITGPFEPDPAAAANGDTADDAQLGLNDGDSEPDTLEGTTDPDSTDPDLDAVDPDGDPARDRPAPAFRTPVPGESLDPAQLDDESRP
jgi:hypothetical protein